MALSQPGNGHAGRSGGAVEIPWWTYGARGMQLWFPSALAEPVSPGAAAGSRYATDPELEFDREVYPVGISLSEVSIIGAPRLLRNPDRHCAVRVLHHWCAALVEELPAPPP